MRQPTHRWLAAAATVVAIADLAQPLLLPWRPKFVGSIAGSLIYMSVAFGVMHGARWALWLAALVPIVPTTLIGLHLAGVELPTPPDTGMVSILVVQLVIAALAMRLLRADT